MRIFLRGKMGKVRVYKDESVDRETEGSIGEAEEVFRNSNEHEPYASLPRVLMVHSRFLFFTFFFLLSRGQDEKKTWKRKGII